MVTASPNPEACIRHVTKLAGFFFAFSLSLPGCLDLWSHFMTFQTNSHFPCLLTIMQFITNLAFFPSENKWRTINPFPPRCTHFFFYIKEGRFNIIVVWSNTELKCWLIQINKTDNNADKWCWNYFLPVIYYIKYLVFDMRLVPWCISQHDGADLVRGICACHFKPQDTVRKNHINFFTDSLNC